MNGNVYQSSPPGHTTDERLENTWRVAVRAVDEAGDLHEKYGRMMRAMATVNGNVVRIMAKLGITPADPIPPMRAEEVSSHSLEIIAAKVTEAAARGEREPGTDAATEVRRVMAEENAKAEQIRIARENAARLAGIDESARKRRAFWIKVAAGILIATGGVAGTRLVEFIVAHIH